MNSRTLAAFLPPLISELLLLLLLLFPNTHTSNSNSYENLFPLIHHFLSSSEIAASLSVLRVSKKRKRTHQPNSDSESTDEDKADELGTGLDKSVLGFTRNPDSFKPFFKMTSSTFEWLSGLLEPLLECRDPVGLPLNLSVQIRLGIGLFRLATGSDYPEISHRFGVSEPVSKFCVKQLCRVLCTNFRFWVGFPSPVELESISSAFEALTGLPNCCGVIACTRFNILRVDKYEESVAAQIVVDSSSKILSIAAGFRGNKDSSKVLKCSTLYKDAEGGSLLNSPPDYIQGVPINQYLVGGRDYPLLPWLMTPFVDPKSGSSEENFNAAHQMMHFSAIRAIASLKNWGVLSRPIEGELKTAVAYIGACSILHNVLLMRDDYSALFDGLGDYSLVMGNTILEESSIETSALVMRNALATRARHIGLEVSPCFHDAGKSSTTRFIYEVGDGLYLSVLYGKIKVHTSRME